MAPEATAANSPAAPVDLAIPTIDKNQLLQLLQTVPGIFPRVVCLFLHPTAAECRIDLG